MNKIFKKHILLIIVLTCVISCKKEVVVNFSEELIETSKSADISINFPKAEGDKTVSVAINTTLQNYIIEQTNLSEDTLTGLSIDDAIERFNTEYNNFITEFPESSQKWEAFIDSEVTYRSPEVISIAINSYLDTGGAHGNTNIKFFNFNPQTGELYQKNDIINDAQGLSKIIENKLKEYITTNSEEPIENFFFGNDFQLPESFGYSDEGLIILYNPYEIAAYAQGIIEFTIPYDEINSFLNIN